MSPDPNSIPFEPEKEKTAEEKFYLDRTIRTQLNPTRRKLTQVKQRGPAEIYKWLLSTGKRTELDKL